MTVERYAEDGPSTGSGQAADAPPPEPWPEPSPEPRPDRHGPEGAFGAPAAEPLDPDHPQWLRRRRKLNILFGTSLATFLGVGLAAIANMVRGLPVDPNAASVMWPLGSATAAAAGLYVWQGVRRSDSGGRWGGRWDGRWGGHRDGHR